MNNLSSSYHWRCLFLQGERHCLRSQHLDPNALEEVWNRNSALHALCPLVTHHQQCRPRPATQPAVRVVTVAAFEADHKYQRLRQNLYIFVMSHSCTEMPRIVFLAKDQQQFFSLTCLLASVFPIHLKKQHICEGFPEKMQVNWTEYLSTYSPSSFAFSWLQSAPWDQSLCIYLLLNGAKKWCPIWALL